MRRHSSNRGVSMMAALLVMASLSAAGAAVILATGREREDSARHGHSLTALECAQAGVAYGKWLFGREEIYVRWNDILRDGVLGMQGTPPTGPLAWNPDLDLATLPGAADRTAWSTLCTTIRCEPFGMRVDVNGDGVLENPGDLDGDGLPDFRVSIRDDVDEFGEALAACRADPLVMASDCLSRDNDLTVVLYAECINARAALGTAAGPYVTSRLDRGGDRETKVVEAILRYVPQMNQYTSQRGGGVASSGQLGR